MMMLLPLLELECPVCKMHLLDDERNDALINRALFGDVGGYHICIGCGRYVETIDHEYKRRWRWKRAELRATSDEDPP